MKRILLVAAFFSLFVEPVQADEGDAQTSQVSRGSAQHMDLDKSIGLNYLTSDKAAADIRASLDSYRPQLDAENARIADAVNEFGRKNTLEAAREAELEKALPSQEELAHVRDMLTQGISPDDIPDSVAKDANILNGGQFANKYSEGMLKKISGLFERQYVDDIAQRDLINSRSPLQKIKDLGVYAVLFYLIIGAECVFWLVRILRRR